MTPRPPERVAVLGAGTMGAGIALCFARAGSGVTLASRRAATLDAARGRIGRSLAQLARAGAPHACSAAEISSRIASSLDLEAAVEEDGAELVIESVVEDLAVKRKRYWRAPSARLHPAR